MKEITITVSDFGKNCQHPFSELVRTACQFQSRILLSCEGRQVNAKSIMGVMAFDLSKGVSVKDRSGDPPPRPRPGPRQ